MLSKSYIEKEKIPKLVNVVVIFTVIACLGQQLFISYWITGLNWVIPLIVAIFVLFTKPGRIRLPIIIWIPWISVIIIYLLMASAPNAFQRSIMIICPLIIGMAISKYSIDEGMLLIFQKIYRYIAIILFVTAIIKTGILITGVLPRGSNLAAEVMTGALLCTLFATNYMYGQKRDLAWWTALAAIPVIGLTRMGVVATWITLSLTFAKMKILKRTILVSILVIFGLSLFYSERVQEVMFFSGKGSIADISFDNPNLSTSGRANIWEKMKYEIAKKPLFGHGANSSEIFVRRLTGELTHPHNDWLRLQYDYGYVGTIIFAFCLLLQFLHAIKKGSKATLQVRKLFFASSLSFIVFALFMLTDNIILYVAFFGNLQFTIIGLSYAAYATSLANDKQVNITTEKSSAYRIKW
jgi:O-antigen ligase